jgi:hypothetical protein
MEEKGKQFIVFITLCPYRKRIIEIIRWMEIDNNSSQKHAKFPPINFDYCLWIDEFLIIIRKKDSSIQGYQKSTQKSLWIWISQKNEANIFFSSFNDPDSRSHSRLLIQDLLQPHHSRPRKAHQNVENFHEILGRFSTNKKRISREKPESDQHKKRGEFIAMVRHK